MCVCVSPVVTPIVHDLRIVMSRRGREAIAVHEGSRDHYPSTSHSSPFKLASGLPGFEVSVLNVI